MFFRSTSNILSATDSAIYNGCDVPPHLPSCGPENRVHLVYSNALHPDARVCICVHVHSLPLSRTLI